MQKIALISQKGGTGKTTLTLNSAVQAVSKELSTAILDLDLQGSSLVWYRKRTAGGIEIPFVKSLHAVALEEVIERLEEAGADLILFDTAPHSQGDALAAARNADLIIIPCKASLIDLTAIRSSVDIANLANKPAVAVITMALAQSNMAEQAKKAIEQYNIPVAPLNIGNRIAFVHAFTEGKGVVEYEPHGQAN